MIDHVSIPVSDLEASKAFYDAVLGVLGFARLIERAATIGYGKRYPEFWLNLRESPTSPDSGHHVCLRAPNSEIIQGFYDSALANGGSDDGAPGLRPEYTQFYYSAFVRDPDGNRIEAVTFI